MHRAYISRINAALTVREIIFTVGLAGVAHTDGELTVPDWGKILAAAESRLVLDCNVDLTPYTDREAQ